MALSTTSVAVVYAVMVETGLSQQDLGKLILAACFVTDLGTVLALGGLFASYGALLVGIPGAAARTTIAIETSACSHLRVHPIVLGETGRESP